MTVHKLSAGDGYTYLTRQVAAGDHHRAAGEELAGYYTATGNPPGMWMGSGTAALGVSGRVSEPQMVALFGHGIHPDADRIGKLERAAGADDRQVARAVGLGQRFKSTTDAAGKRSVAGYDLVFTPVKSVSLLWALGDATVREQVEAAHHEAVAATIGWLEEHAAFTRTGRGGIAQVDTQGLVCAAFDHRDSRLGDPDLHTHVAVSNKVCTREPGPGGRPRWLALDARALYHAGVAASERYNTRLEDAVARRLGARFVERSDSAGRENKRPVREVAGIPVGLVRAFSQRRTLIEQRYGQLAAGYRHDHGRDPDRGTRVRLAQQATLETRETKQPPRTLADQLAEWRRRAGDLIGTAALRRLVPDAVGRPVAHTEITPGLLESTAREVVASVEAERATWTRWNLIAEIERATRSWHLPTLETRDRVINEVLERATAPRTTIQITAPELVAEPAALRRADGQSVFAPHGAERYTSEATLAAEAALLEAAHEPAGITAPAGLVDDVVAVVERRSRQPLDPGQRLLVEAFTATDRRLVAGIGAAGSGKTTAMRAACAVWDADGRRVIPLAASAKAADVLAAELGRRAENLHKFLHEQHHQHEPPTHSTDTGTCGDDGFFRLRAGDVVLVDEAGMAGTHRLHQLTQAAQAAGAAVRLIGDPHQLAAVEAGGALRLLAHDTDTVELTALHRFTDPDEAAATLGLRHGQTDAIEFYQTRDRIRAGSQDAMVEAAFDAWRTDMLTGRVSVMGTVSNDLAGQLSARARWDRITLGAVEMEGTALADDNAAGVGDWVTTRSNHRRLRLFGGSDFVKNGDRWTVTTRRPDGSLTVQHQRHHGRAHLPSEYVAEHVELAYATTAHRLQGDTVDTAHPIITEATSREALYVLASRARDHTTLYVATEPAVDVATEHAPPHPATAREVLEQVLATETAEKSATETIRTTLATAGQSSTLAAQYGHAVDESHARPDAADWPTHLAQRAAAIRERTRPPQTPPPPPAPPAGPAPPAPAPAAAHRPGPRRQR